MMNGANVTMVQLVVPHTVLTGSSITQRSHVVPLQPGRPATSWVVVPATVPPRQGSVHGMGLDPVGVQGEPASASPFMFEPPPQSEPALTLEPSWLQWTIKFVPTHVL